MALEFIPIGTFLSLLTKQVIKTALAAQDVLIGKESFKVLSQHLFDIEPVLKELQLQKLNDSQAARKALESLEADVKKASNLIEKNKNRSRFYLLVNCRNIVKEVQDVTRDIGRSLASLSLANTELLSGISDQVNRLQHEMQRVELEASHSQLQILDKLNQGLKEQKLDQGFANDMLEEIARAVGVPVEPLEISKELESFRREKEEAACRKERAEVFILEQVIELLSRADAARDYEEIKKQYFQRVQAIEKYDAREESIPPFNSFICCINGTVMVDPVSLCTGTTCERVAIMAWFDQGEETDPETGEVLEDTSLRSNLPLRKSIEEWKELNYCLKIRSSQTKLLSGEDSLVEQAMSQIQDLIKENSINKDWISIAGLTDIVVSIFGSSHNKDIKRKILITLKDLAEGHPRNKEKLIDSWGWDHIIACLVRDPSISKAAVELLFELLQERSGWNVSVSRKFSQQCNGIFLLVNLRKGPVQESAEYAENILKKLFEVDEENYCRAAKSGFYEPLIDRIVQGPESSRITMVRTLTTLELMDSDLMLLGEGGVIPALLQMASRNLESKQLSLAALVKLLDCQTNKNILASAGGVPFIMNFMFTPHLPTTVLVKCSEIIDKLCSGGDGIKFLVDGNGNQINLEQTVANLFSMQQSAGLSSDICRPAMRALLEICQHEEKLVKASVLSSNGISIVLNLLDDSDLEIQEIAVKLLFLFSQYETEAIVEYLQRPRRLEALVGFLENDKKDDLQMAAVGLLANLPKSELSLTMKLIELDGLDPLLKILKTGTVEVKENSLSALFRFTDPSNLELQRTVVERGTYPLLVSFLRADSATVKARAAALIGNLSCNSPRLTAATKSTGCWRFRLSRVPLCRVHRGICTVTSTFCMVEAKALPDLVNLLQEEVNATAYEALRTLSTLVLPGVPYPGINILHEANAIKPMLRILNWGTDILKEEALTLLEKVFTIKEMVDYYGSMARLSLIGLTSRNLQEDGHLRRKATRVLSLIERYSKSSSSFLDGFISRS